jgi:hypothetical protein
MPARGVPRRLAELTESIDERKQGAVAGRVQLEAEGLLVSPAQLEKAMAPFAPSATRLRAEEE